jgi:hypothetical protein
MDDVLALLADATARAPAHGHMIGLPRLLELFLMYTRSPDGPLSAIHGYI